MYALTRTAADLGLDMTAWLAALMVPAQLMIGPGKGRRPGRDLKTLEGPNAGRVVDMIQRKAKRGARETLIELPNLKDGVGDHDLQRARAAVGHVSAAVRGRGRKRGFVPPMPDLPPIRGFAGKLVEKELAKRRER